MSVWVRVMSGWFVVVSFKWLRRVFWCLQSLKAVMGEGLKRAIGLLWIWQEVLRILSGKVLAKTLWMVYYISGSAIGLKLPLMPLGVDHMNWRLERGGFSQLKLPLMPLGVDHMYRHYGKYL